MFLHSSVQSLWLVYSGCTSEKSKYSVITHFSFFVALELTRDCMGGAAAHIPIGSLAFSEIGSGIFHQCRAGVFWFWQLVVLPSSANRH